MAAVMSQINALEKIYQDGLEDSYLDRAISKIVTYEISNA